MPILWDLSGAKELLIPVLPQKVMDKIGEDVRERVHAARTARRRAHTLLERAKRAVEIAIEEPEAAALRFLVDASEGAVT